jgi:hypothetical protein
LLALKAYFSLIWHKIVRCLAFSLIISVLSAVLFLVLFPIQTCTAVSISSVFWSRGTKVSLAIDNEPVSTLALIESSLWCTVLIVDSWTPNNLLTEPQDSQSASSFKIWNLFFQTQ